MWQRETVEAYGLGAIGFVKGVHEVFVKPAYEKLVKELKNGKD